MYEINSRFKELRKHLGLSQFYFAKKIDRSVGCISNIERNKCFVSDETIDSVCSTFGVNKVWLVSGTGPMFTSGNEKGQVDIDTIGSRVRKIRKDNHFSQTTFAEEIGYTLMHVSYVENGKSKPSREFIEKVCARFGISSNWLLSGEGEEKAAEPLLDDKLIEWLRKHPEEIRRLRLKSGLD